MRASPPLPVQLPERQLVVPHHRAHPAEQHGRVGVVVPHQRRHHLVHVEGRGHEPASRRVLVEVRPGVDQVLKPAEERAILKQCPCKSTGAVYKPI